MTLFVDILLCNFALGLRILAIVIPYQFYYID